MRRLAGAALLVGACLAAACGGETPLGPGGGVSPLRVLMVTATAGFRHDSIANAVAAMRTVGSASGEFTVTPADDVALVSSTGLAGFDIVMFALTSGELALSADQKRALIAFVEGGKGFIGVHSATDTLYEWPEYERLVGTYFREHPWTQQGIVEVEDITHPSTRTLNTRFAIFEEFYTFRDNPRGRVQVLLRLDAASVGASGDYPLAWAHNVGAGRAYYNALGHFPATWSDPQFRQQMAGAIRWVGRR
jgi:type 1 glutamine amidotransferase